MGVNDDGYVVGLRDSRTLLESLPNKINDKLGIVASIKIHHADEQGINIKYGNNIPSNISEKLVNRYASGKINSAIIKNCADTEIRKLEQTILNRELQGFELKSFLLERAGKTWDSVPIPGVSVDDLDKSALTTFRSRAVKSMRMSEQDVAVSDELLLRNLKLFDGNYLTRAAILLFYPDPEQYVTGAYLKIAFFAPAGAYGMNEDADIIYQDDVHGPLITQADKAIDILYTKYFKALISYEKLQRTETYILPMGIIRDLLLNPINHKQYEKGVPVQISVFEDHIELFNVGTWPESIPLDDTLYQRHESIPYNPKVADVFYRAGEIESWGRGFLKIRLECEKINARLPNLDKKGSGITVKAFACEQYLHILNANKASMNRTVKEVSFLAASDGAYITDDKGIPLVVETVRDI